MGKYKRILDTVHGYISIEEELFDDFIDTAYFQRLRRIEQTSIRALFPCARHDRFIHSLGVYHLGNMIVQALMQTDEKKDFPENYELCFKTYRLACLLHDIGHSPFSHTFEEFFDNKEHRLTELLDKEVNNVDFHSDSIAFLKQAASHEKMSALLSIKVFKDKIVEYGANPELLVRMIIGCKYQDVGNHSFENALIDLVHGDIIDADGLDYVIRDSWASGYSSSNVDSERLISSIRLHKDDNGNWAVCYSPKALSEIEAVLSVKTFQQKYVFTHHTVVFEQRLLIKAMESAALYHFDLNPSSDMNGRQEALEHLCNFEAFISPVTLPKHLVSLIYPEDDDFISLMKYIKDDRYVKQWLSRQYEYVPLWKSTADFFTLFPELHKCEYTSNCWLFSNACKEFLFARFKIPQTDIWIESGTGADKGIKASKVSFLVGDKIIPYKKLYSNDKNSFEPKIKPFYYIFIPKSIDGVTEEDIIAALQTKIKESILAVS